MRTHILDLVIFCDDRETADELVELVASLPYSSPRARSWRSADEDQSDVVADARVFCSVSGDSSGMQVCSELVSLSSAARAGPRCRA